MAIDATVSRSEPRAESGTLDDALTELSAGRRDFERFLVDLSDRAEELRQRCALLQQERTMLQQQLKAAQRQIAQLSDMLKDVKRGTARQQAQWNGELKQLRRLLEGLHRRYPQDKPTTPR
jgi:predicted  nucleic acid-binding Zn-ribbon protein